jgi:hypothetical protein
MTALELFAGAAAATLPALEADAVPPALALAEACGRLVAGAHRAWTALRSSNLDHTALAGALRRHRLTVPAALGVAR